MKWYSKILIAFIIIGAFLGICWWQAEIRKHPMEVRYYTERSKKMALPEEKQRLKDYVLNDTVWNTFTTKDIPMWRHLLIYLRLKLEYTEDPDMIRHYTPIEILNHSQPKRYLVGIVNDKQIWYEYEGVNGTFGRCEEFTITYTALCLAFDIRARMVVCLSDHVWTEIFEYDVPRGGRWDGNGVEIWFHVDPTENKWDDKYLYMRDWGKDFGGVDKVYAIENGEIEEITERYIWKDE